ncbi:HAD-IIIA family hydrolase [Tropicimonas sp. IMCC34011]|uniref:D-glycero-alpha-D-manno-heptose-1,7-bisphosphate 7-phosphatase n=1 Tax=Tropicimonas sp. IMCC34011 TaxID=2248759 RepID=UPI000E28730C|nr:HAD family hydrolase [Tropicimonas sp. IMCC34011]
MMRRAVFLDRDGTVIEDRHFLSDPRGVRLLPGAAKGMRRFAEAGYRIVIVSNQSGIGRGLFARDALSKVMRETDRQLVAEKVFVQDWQNCPHAPDAGCTCRKPGPGLLDRAQSRGDIDFGASWMIGDRPSDIGAGRARGVPGILVMTGQGMCHVDWARREGVPIAESLEEAAEIALT